MYEQAKYLPVGDQGLLVEFGQSISPGINKMVRGFALALDKSDIPGITEYIPTYRSVLIFYDPLVWEIGSLIARLGDIENSLSKIKLPEPSIFYLPVAYGDEYGPDLNNVCHHTGFTKDEVVNIHTSVNYLIYMLGFTPGFPYLGGMDERISTPRHETPRIKLLAGSVGIAGSQTGIYPVESPGGWQIIGRTPVKLFDPLKEKPVLLNPGDYICFFEVSSEKYRQIAKEVESDRYVVKVSALTEGEG
ncbi:MAG TPA: 5-oxoprolinase subunit PxpB [Clostridia bacterium]|nr:5-oxoprolinase subunit PxpB [Clostridia bacterium]